MISLQSVSKDFAGDGHTTRVLRDVTLSIEEGELVAITGASGSGKTTLMNILGCLDRPSGGHYALDGENVLALADRDLCRVRNQKIGFVFQLFHLLPRLSVLDNVLLPLLYAERYPADARARAGRLIDLVGLTHRSDYRPGQLSGGEQQRAAIARALITNPRVLLADEPTGNLDSSSSADVLALFRDLHERGNTIVLVTHAPETAAIARRVIRLHDGQVVS